MSNYIRTLILIIFSLGLTSCFRYYNVIGADSSVNQTLAPKDKERQNNLHKSSSCVTNILGLVAIGDSSVESAKKSGYIDKISFFTTTYESLRVYIPIFQKGCTIVTGTKLNNTIYH